jgi:hypothetical protein
MQAEEVFNKRGVMRLFAPFCLLAMLFAADASAYKLCMAEHAKPTSCTKSGDYDSWTLTCTGGTVSKILGHCEDEMVMQNLYIGPSSSSSVTGEIISFCYINVRCVVDSVISNAQGMHLSMVLGAMHGGTSCSLGLLADFRSNIYNDLTASDILSKIPL